MTPVGNNASDNGYPESLTYLPMWLIMWPNDGDNMHVVRALFTYDGDNTGVVRVFCPNDGDNTHAVRALMEELTSTLRYKKWPFNGI